MYNPFKPIVETKYNINNIKKVYDIFPSSLRRAQLSSSELVELLRSQVFDRDVTIDELRRQLAELSTFNETTLDEQLANLGFDSISDLLNQFLEGGTEDAEEAALLAEGYKRISDTKLYVFVDKNPQSTYMFNINHTDENAGFPSSDIKSPLNIEFKNIGDVPVYFVKQENWTSNDANKSLPGSSVNAFKFIQYPEANKVFSIQPKEIKTTRIELNYKSKDSYKNAGLTRDKNKTNTWYGEMLIYGTNQETTNSGIVKSQIPTSIGNMRLYRDKN